MMMWNQKSFVEMHCMKILNPWHQGGICLRDCCLRFGRSSYWRKFQRCILPSRASFCDVNPCHFHRPRNKEEPARYLREAATPDSSEYTWFGKLLGGFLVVEVFDALRKYFNGHVPYILLEVSPIYTESSKFLEEDEIS